MSLPPATTSVVFICLVQTYSALACLEGGMTTHKNYVLKFSMERVAFLYFMWPFYKKII